MAKQSRWLTFTLLFSQVLHALASPVHATGLDGLAANTNCIAPARPDSNPDLRVRTDRFITGLVFPTVLQQSPVDPDIWYVAERHGRIQRVQGDTVVGTALDIRATVVIASEGGLLGLALHPDFANNGHAFVQYTPEQTDAQYQQKSIISRFTSFDGGLTFSAASEVVLIAVDHTKVQHVSGDLHFGPDGYLYASLGDNTAGDVAQDTFDLHGSILRIDVDSASPYAIPPDNPFAAGGGAPEVWAYGLRNPYRFAIDPATGSVYAGDVGQGTWEEVDVVTSGGNYGWPIREGAHCFQTATCDSTGLIDPIIEYPHTTGCAVLGGPVYRGAGIPALQEALIFGDLCSRKIWAGFPDGQGGWTVEELLVNAQEFYGFAQDNEGEVYVLEYGRVVKLVPNPSPPPPPFPTLLSETGCVDPADPTRPASGLLPYGVNVPLWSDGALKERWLAMPPGAQLRILNTGDFEFPVGTVFMKNFYINGVLGETRLFMRHDDGGWGGYSYEWNSEGTDAVLLSDAKQSVIGGQPWTFPSPSQCLQCHTFVAGHTLGPELPQINGDFFYEETGRTANQLTTWEHLGLIQNPSSLPPNRLPAFRDMSVDETARAYLHVNCSNCHRTTGGTGVKMDLRYNASTEQDTCDVPPAKGDLGVAGARRIKPGAPHESVLYLRAQTTRFGRMPPLARSTSRYRGPDNASRLDRELAVL